MGSALLPSNAAQSSWWPRSAWCGKSAIIVLLAANLLFVFALDVAPRLGMATSCMAGTARMRALRSAPSDQAADVEQLEAPEWTTAMGRKGASRKAHAHTDGADAAAYQAVAADTLPEDVDHADAERHTDYDNPVAETSQDAPGTESTAPAVQQAFAEVSAAAAAGAHNNLAGAFDYLAANASGVMPQAPQRRAIISFMESDTYLAGALTLAFSLRRHGNVLPLVLCHLPDHKISPAGQRALQRAGWQLREVQRIPPFREAPDHFKNQCAPLLRSCFPYVCKIVRDWCTEMSRTASVFWLLTNLATSVLLVTVLVHHWQYANCQPTVHAPASCAHLQVH